MQTDKDVLEYYEAVSSKYDDSRFGNSYGRFIHTREYAFLKSKINDSPKLKSLDIGCGTGRLLEFSEYGIDISANMLEMARAKYPGRHLYLRNAADTEFDDKYFDRIISFHVIMHLDKEKTQDIFNEAGRILKKGGRFFFDFPSKKRRDILNRKRNGWHGNNSYGIVEIEKALGQNWRIVSTHGILFIPIHRFPEKIRQVWSVVDLWLCRSVLKEYASYIIIEAEKI